MDRLFQLRETIFYNLRKIEEYGDAELVLLNYNSHDGLHEFVKSDSRLQDYIKKGFLKYYRTLEPVYYSSPHAKNCVHKFATGDIVCNLDADNYIVKGFIEEVVSMIDVDDVVIGHLGKEREVFDPHKTNWGNGYFGRIFMKRPFFNSIGGYDEELEGMGYQDVDIILRAIENGAKYKNITNPKFMRAIQNPTEDKMMNTKEPNFFECNDKNSKISQENIQSGKIISNVGRDWGKIKIDNDSYPTIDGQKFCIIASFRSGSHFLIDVLSQHPNIFCHNELFNIVNPKIGLLASQHVGQLEKLEALSKFQTVDYRMHYGFKIMMNQWEWVHDVSSIEDLCQYLKDNNWKIITLNRQNTFDKAVSMCVARKRELYRSFKSSEFNEPVDPEIFKIMYNRSLEDTKNMEGINKEFSDLVLDYSQIKTEDGQRKIVNEIYSLLDLPDYNFTPRTVKLSKKVNITNLDELKDLETQLKTY
jgi:hypothetical protein